MDPSGSSLISQPSPSPRQRQGSVKARVRKRINNKTGNRRGVMSNIPSHRCRKIAQPFLELQERCALALEGEAPSTLLLKKGSGRQ